MAGARANLTIGKLQRLKSTMEVLIANAQKEGCSRKEIMLELLEQLRLQGTRCQICGSHNGHGKSDPTCPGCF